MKGRYTNVIVKLVLLEEDIVTASGDNIIEDEWVD